MLNTQKTDLMTLINYILENEDNHFNEFIDAGGLPENHIFAVANRVFASIIEGEKNA